MLWSVLARLDMVTMARLSSPAPAPAPAPGEARDSCRAAGRARGLPRERVAA